MQNVHAEKRASLFASINRTRTAMGRRILRLNILQPLADAELIRVRQEAVEVLLRGQNEGTLKSIRAALSHLPDLDSLISALVRIPRIETRRDSEQRLALLLSLFASLKSLMDLKVHLLQLDCESEESSLLGRVLPGEIAPDALVVDLLGDLEGVFDPGVLAAAATKELTQEQRAFVVKSEGALLEVARKTFRETVDDIYEYSQALQSKSRPIKIQHPPPKKKHCLWCRTLGLAPAGALSEPAGVSLCAAPGGPKRGPFPAHRPLLQHLHVRVVKPRDLFYAGPAKAERTCRRVPVRDLSSIGRVSPALVIHLT